MKINESDLILMKGDITREETEAIVNAANSSLLGGGGVDGAIHRAGGPQILEECRKIGSCPPGEARITTGGRLKAKFVIHTVGPVYRDGKHGEPQILANAYVNSLQICLDRGIRSVAFPSISTGAYGYPAEGAAKIALSAVVEFLREHAGIGTVRFVLFDQATFDVYQKVISDLSKEK